MDNISLAELVILIQKALKDNLEPSYWVIAEIGEMNINQKGHCYLELIETRDDRVIAKSRATIWSYTYSNLSTWFQGITGQPLSQGMKILANVQVNFHELYGFSLNIKDIDASFTLGEKERIKQEVINKLIADGVFEMNKELALPLVPQRVAVISSSTAAGFGDFSDQLITNHYHYQVDTTLFQSIMQGDEAPASIIAALHKIIKEDNFDLVVLIRGGGSQLDLDCFNDYDLCSHLAQFPLPVITGIGHERDNTIADMVAHTKQKTPTAVAEFLLQGFIDFETQIEELALKISRATTGMVQQERMRLESFENRISLKSKNIIDYHKQRLQAYRVNLGIKARNQTGLLARKIKAIEERHSDLDPRNVLKRGYTFTTINRNSIFAKKAKKDDEITTYTLEQIIESKVTKTRKNDKI